MMQALLMGPMKCFDVMAFHTLKVGSHCLIGLVVEALLTRGSPFEQPPPPVTHWLRQAKPPLAFASTSNSSPQQLAQA